MSDGKRYVLDANVFIEAHQRYYALDVCPGFWLALIRQHEKQAQFSASTKSRLSCLQATIR